MGKYGNKTTVLNYTSVQWQIIIFTRIFSQPIFSTAQVPSPLLADIFLCYTVEDKNEKSCKVKCLKKSLKQGTQFILF